MGHSSADKIIDMHSQLKQPRDMLATMYDDCLFYYQSEMQSDGLRKSTTGEESQPLDMIGSKSANSLVSGLFSNTISMGDEFFGFRLNNKKASSDTVERFLQDAAKTCLEQMQSSNFSLVVHEGLGQLAALNTAVIYSEYRAGTGLLFSSFPITQCAIAEDYTGKVNTLSREFTMTAAQAYGRWGEDCHDKIKSAYADTSQRYSKFEFIHYVAPRNDRDQKSLLAKDKPFSSQYVDVQNKHIVEDGGYDSFPYAVPRFYKSGASPYGRGPSFSALPTLREVVEVRARIVDGINLKLVPPVFMPVGYDAGTVDLSPGAVNAYSAQDGLPIFYQPNIDLQWAAEHRKELKEEIREAFFVDVFKALEDQKNMTAFEVSERVAEKVQQIIPMVSRLYDELYSVLIERIFALLIDNGVINDIPEEMANQDYKVDYTTKLDQRLQSLEIGQVLKSVQEASSVLATQAELPDIGNFLNVDSTIKAIFRGNNTDPELVHSDDEREELRAKQAEAQAAAQQAEMMQGMIKPLDPQKAVEEGSLLDGADPSMMGME